MSRRRQTSYKRQAFESDLRPKETFAAMYESMLMSLAFKDLTGNQKALLLCMKARLYGRRRPKEGEPLSFTFNQSKWLKGCASGYELYSNRNQFYKDCNALIDHGFIECIERNKNQRTSNIYRFSDKWHGWKAKPP